MVAPLIASAGLSVLDTLSSALDTAKTGTATKAVKTGIQAKAKTASEDFEAVFLNNMFQQMFTSTGGEGPMGGKGAGGVWRSFLTDEYAKSFAKNGGIGIAKQVYGTLLAQQEIKG